MTNPYKKREPVLVPHWIIKQLARSNLPLNTVLKLKELQQVCSQEDLAILLDLNENPLLVTGVSSIGMGLFRYWSQYAPEDLKKIQQVQTLYQGKCDARLYAAPDSSSTVAIQNSNACIAFEVQEVESGLDPAGVLLLIIHPGYFGGPQSSEVQQQLRREYLKQSYVFLTFDEIAKDPVFMQYLLSA